MNRKLRSTKSACQTKEEQVNFLLEDIEKNLEDYKKATELRDKQLADAKKKYLTEQKIATIHY